MAHINQKIIGGLNEACNVFYMNISYTSGITYSSKYVMYCNFDFRWGKLCFIALNLHVIHPARF